MNVRSSGDDEFSLQGADNLKRHNHSLGKEAVACVLFSLCFMVLCLCFSSGRRRRILVPLPWRFQPPQLHQVLVNVDFLFKGLFLFILADPHLLLVVCLATANSNTSNTRAWTLCRCTMRRTKRNRRNTVCIIWLFCYTGDIVSPPLPLQIVVNMARRSLVLLCPDRISTVPGVNKGPRVCPIRSSQGPP
jgi:hypothetical protein